MNSMTLMELKDAIAKAIADVRGHGMREKCQAEADAVLAVVAPLASRAMALERALAEYPAKHTNQLQARKVCAGVAALAGVDLSSERDTSGDSAAVPMTPGVSEVWVVLNEAGQPIYCASWPEACHEHINDAINEHGIEEASAWKVRRFGSYVFVPCHKCNSTRVAVAAPSQPEDMDMDGASLITAERRRQIDVEGRTADHDDTSAPGSLPMAAAAYALGRPMVGAFHIWPWDMSWWKPGEGIAGRIRDHAKAGALLAAEIDRLQRLAAQPKDADHDTP